MIFKEEMEIILKDMVRKVEYERFLMGLGKYEMAKRLGMHYHTYVSFVKQDRMSRPDTVGIIVKFLTDRNVDIKSLSDAMNHIIKSAPDEIL